MFGRGGLGKATESAASMEKPDQLVNIPERQVQICAAGKRNPRSDSREAGRSIELDTADQPGLNALAAREHVPGAGARARA